MVKRQWSIIYWNVGTTRKRGKSCGRLLIQKNESRDSARRSRGDKAHNGVHQSNREIKQLESKVYIDSKAGYGGRASMDGSKQNGLNMY
jgi:hypothetical protein